MDPVAADRPSAVSPNPYVFVVGSPRSGTTLLQRMLDNHPLLAVSNDTHFIPRVIKDLPDPNPPVTPELVDAVCGYRRFYRLGLSDAEVDEAAAGCATYTDLVSALYTAFGRQRGKDLAGEKTPDYVKCLPLLHELFPAARSVHIYRDGRDVALSVLEWAHDGKGPSKLELWADEPVAVCALWWRAQVRRGREDGAALGASLYREICYETLVAHAEDVLDDTATFLGLPHAPEMAAYHVGRQKALPGRSAKANWLPPTSGLRDWHEGMTVRDLSIFEELAGDLLEELGYERGAPAPTAEVSEVAERSRSWWETTQHRTTHRATHRPTHRPSATGA